MIHDKKQLIDLFIFEKLLSKTKY